VGDYDGVLFLDMQNIGRCFEDSASERGLREKVLENIRFGGPVEAHVVVNDDFRTRRGLVESATLGVIKAGFFKPRSRPVLLDVVFDEGHGRSIEVMMGTKGGEGGYGLFLEGRAES
jgi:hypothetical protein